jgi:Flp pilus assembly pilin Flp
MRDPGTSDDGSSAVEYAILLSSIAGVIVTAVLTFGGSVQELFVNTCDRLALSTGGQMCSVAEPDPDPAKGNGKGNNGVGGGNGGSNGGGPGKGGSSGKGGANSNGG